MHPFLCARLLSIRRVDTGETSEDDADVLILARGILSEPRWPDIPGLDEFKGEVMHSALWKDEFVVPASPPLLRVPLLTPQQLRLPK